MEPDAGLDPSKARDITFTVDASVNWKEKPISRKTQPKPQPQPREDADPDDVNGMEGWAVLFDPPEKNVRQARCSHEGVYAGDMQGWAQHNYIMTHYYEDGKRSTWMGQALFNGTVLGRRGSVAIALWGSCAHDRLVQHWRFYPETATGELEGIRGGGTFQGSTEQGLPVTLQVQFD